MLRKLRYGDSIIGDQELVSCLHDTEEPNSAVENQNISQMYL